MVLRQPHYIFETGQREAQEDALWPHVGARTGRTFVVCDGMGGPQAGRKAAATVADALGQWFDTHAPAAGGLNDRYFAAGLREAFQALDGAFPQVAATQPRKPGTTMAALVMGADRVLVAHVGDCRVYQFRPGSGFVFRTTDHSIVAQMVARGEITEAEAANHPKRKVVTRAMLPLQGAKRPEADMRELTDVRPGDKFLLCTDGIREFVSDRRLAAILGDERLTDAARMEAIKEICRSHATADNYTAALVTVAAISAPRQVQATPPAAPGATAHSAAAPGVRRTQRSAKQESVDPTKGFVKTWFWLVVSLTALIILMGFYFGCSRHSETISVNPLGASEQTTDSIPAAAP